MKKLIKKIIKILFNFLHFIIKKQLIFSANFFNKFYLDSIIFNNAITFSLINIYNIIIMNLVIMLFIYNICFLCIVNIVLYINNLEKFFYYVKKIISFIFFAKIINYFLNYLIFIPLIYITVILATLKFCLEYLSENQKLDSYNFDSKEQQEIIYKFVKSLNLINYVTFRGYDWLNIPFNNLKKLQQEMFDDFNLKLNKIRLWLKINKNI